MLIVLLLTALLIYVGTYFTLLEANCLLCKVVPVHAMMSWDGGGVAPLIFNSGYG